MLLMPVGQFMIRVGDFKQHGVVMMMTAGILLLANAKTGFWIAVAQFCMWMTSVLWA